MASFLLDNFVQAVRIPFKLLAMEHTDILLSLILQWLPDLVPIGTLNANHSLRVALPIARASAEWNARNQGTGKVAFLAHFFSSCSEVSRYFRGGIGLAKVEGIVTPPNKWPVS